MRILFCCEFYYPSVGGVQTVIQQIAERLVKRGHEVTVATTKLPERTFDVLNGVKVEEFYASGNIVRGMHGEIQSYQNYLLSNTFDAILIKAAQQWTFDALWGILDQLKTPKVFIPCGFSGLYEPGYQAYFKAMPDILRKFDHLVFYASKYRDIDFVKENGIDNFTVLPNGASEIEFNQEIDPDFRFKNGIKEGSFVVLTVGSRTGMKGHLELVKAFQILEIHGEAHVTLILNGNECKPNFNGNLIRVFLGVLRAYGIKGTLKRALKRVLWKTGFTFGNTSTVEEYAKKVNKSATNKQVLITDYKRPYLIQAYMTADLFAFASNVEYSPLVLFEAAAAGTPFLTVDVGNAVEIASWTGGGVVCHSTKDEKGYTHADINDLAYSIASLMQNKDELVRLGNEGRSNWLSKFTWDQIALQYEDVFKNLLQPEKH